MSRSSKSPSKSRVPDPELERSLRKAVEQKYTEGKQEEISVNAVRRISEREIGLSEGFYINGGYWGGGKTDWKAESKSVIKDEVETQEALKASGKPGKAPLASTAQKRGSPAVEKTEVEVRPSKRRKTVSPVIGAVQDEDLESSELSELDDGKPSDKANGVKKKKAAVSRKKSADGKNGVSSKDTKALTKQPNPKTKSKKVESEDENEKSYVDSDSKMDEPEPAANPPDSGSELSSLIDEDEAPKKRRKSKDASESKSKSKSKSKSQKLGKAKPQKPSEDDPDTAEIKRLQGWLVKCGIRKLWGKELKPYETSREKIKHLRDMLAEVGMTGRYSQEKAASIREARELAADIEAVTEGNERWGKDQGDAESGDNKGPPARRALVRGAQTFDFLSSDGEETD